MKFQGARRLSDFANHSEKSTVRGQLFVDLRANSIAICRKYTKIFTDQAVLQQILVKSDSPLTIPLFSRPVRPSPCKHKVIRTWYRLREIRQPLIQL